VSEISRERKYHRPMKIRWQSHIFWLLVLIGHAAAAGTWWGLMPHGFPVTHRRFWMNEALPWVAIVLFVATIALAYRGRLRAARGMLVVLAAMWLTAGVYGRFVFPVSFGMKWLALIGMGGIIALATRDEALETARLPVALTIACIAGGIAMGAWLIRAERAPDPATHPLAIATPATLPAVDEVARSRTLRGADVKTDGGVIVMQRGRYVFYLQPLLDFVSRSEDRCWTCLTPPAARTPVVRTLSGFETVDDGVNLAYGDLGRSWLSVRDTADAGFITLDAICILDAPVFSHLNSYAHFELAGHQDLAVTFSPCPDQRIAVTHSEYPTGAPARFAYFEESSGGGRLVVCEAASGEKGPFSILAQGKMARSEPLTITLIDQGMKILRVTLYDWTAQASTALSPTAGWRVPENAIEFSRDRDEASSTALFFVTLAGTSVGRGWDSVGHAAGTYRNRMKVEWVDAEENK
jgi:hypothetical protein